MITHSTLFSSSLEKCGNNYRVKIAVNNIKTSVVIRLVAIAAFNGKCIDICLRFLDRYSNFFYNNKLTRELRGLRVKCLHLLGKLPEAVVEEESLTQEESSFENLVNLANLYYQIGDFKKLGIIGEAYQSINFKTLMGCYTDPDSEKEGNYEPTSKGIS